VKQQALVAEDSIVSRRRVCLVATVPFAFNVFMRSHVELLQAEYDVTLVANGSQQDLIGILGPHVRFISMPIERKISLKKDLVALMKLWKFFRLEKFDAVISLLPKSGLLGMLAARFSGVPIRINIFNGEVWANDHGFMRQLLKFTDRIIVRCATNLVAVSPSQRSFLIESKIVSTGDIDVVANGSITGVNQDRFRPDLAERQRLRSLHKIADNSVVFLFLGRLNRDKGVHDLILAFTIAASQELKYHLLVVGPDEDGFDIDFEKLAVLFPGRVHRVGFTDQPEVYLAASDVICLPSYREGFGMVLIEAAASGLPAIASRIYGITDAVEDGVTGILHSPGSDIEIAEAILLLGSDNAKRSSMANAAKARASTFFSEQYVMQSFADYYRKILSPSNRLLMVVNSASSLLSHRLELALAARECGYEVHVASPPGVGVDILLSNGLIYHPIPLSRSGMNLVTEFKSLLALVFLFLRIKPNIVHLVTIKPVLYGGIAARLAGVPGVVAAISGLGFVFMKTGSKATMLCRLVVWLYSIAFGKKNLKVIFQNSDDWKTIVRATGLKPSKVIMIPGSGVNLSRFSVKSLPSSTPVVVMVSRLLRDKGVIEFVEAANLLKMRGVQASFLLVGDPDPGNPTSIEAVDLVRWRTAGVVDVLGQRDDIADVFAQSHLVVLPSYREGLPKVLLEAAACGRAVVTTDVPGCRDAIDPGVTGILVPVRNAFALADAIQDLINDPVRCKTMGEAGRIMAEKVFDVRQVVASHLHIYKELINNS
jgi:glycosyltransferase involved in cell wall biosynthesis